MAETRGGSFHRHIRLVPIMTSPQCSGRRASAIRVWIVSCFGTETQSLWPSRCAAKVALVGSIIDNVLTMAVAPALSKTTRIVTRRAAVLAAILLVGTPSLSVSSSSYSSSSSSRSLEEQNNNGFDNAYSYFEYDLSQFSVEFDKCQYVKMYDGEIANDEESESPLALKHFVLFKLCPTDVCGSGVCDGSSTSTSSSSSASRSNSNSGSNVEEVPYGKYTVPVDEYLQYTLEYQRQAYENACNGCDEECDNGNDEGQEEDGEDNNNENQNNNNCNANCPSICQEYQNLEANGYVDASQYVECQQIDYNNANQQQDGDNNQQLYTGPRCNSNGKIVIGLFSDENCWEPYDEMDVEDVLGAQLSYLLLQHTNQGSGSGTGDDESNSMDASTCLPCKEYEDNNENNEGDQNDGDDVNEMCENLYLGSAKCESDTGITAGFIQTKRDDGEYENQVENEFMACTFINSLIWNSYTETGEINIDDPQDEILRYVTNKQWVALSLLFVSIAAILGVMYYYHRRIQDMKLAHPLVIRGDALLT